jgi:hypothetical protein
MTFAPKQRPNALPRGLRRIVFWILIVVLAAGIWRESPANGTRGGATWLAGFVLVLALFGAWIFLSTVWQMIARRRTTRADGQDRGQPTSAAVPPAFVWLEFGILAITAGAVLWSRRASSRIHVGPDDFVLAFALIGACAFVVMIWQAIVRSTPPRAGQQNRPIG